MSTDSPDVPKPKAEWNKRTIPPYLKELETWFIWGLEDKVPKAPWITGHMYPVKWGADVVEDPTVELTERPETDFETAKRWADIPPSDLHQSYPFPDVTELPDELAPTIMLPHDPPDPPVMLVDFDDVRDAETGEISREVLKIINRLGGYTEVSRSGTGVHTYVRAELPGRLGKFIGELDSGGDIEMYDHGRFVGCTWKHVTGTGVEVPECQDVVEDLVRTYEDDVYRRRREGEQSKPPEREIPQDAADALAKLRKSKSSNKRSAYYRLDIRAIADRGAFSSYRDRSWQGPHPKHGASSGTSWDSESTNFNVAPRENHWYCFLHDVGGGPLSLISVLEGIVNCGGAKRIHEDSELLLQTCIAARDKYSSSLDDEVPPYKALVEVAKRADLAMEDEGKEILGKDTHRLAMIIYSQLSSEDLA